MVSTQVHRFQKRIAGLQNHHELSLKRYKTARQNYTSFSRDVLNSLVVHLSETEKRAKKSRRIAKPRASNSQVAKHGRPDCLACNLPLYSPYGNDPVSCRDGQFTAYDELQETIVERSAKNIGSYDYSMNLQICTDSVRCNEPVFPPPTFIEHNDCSLPETHKDRDICGFTSFHTVDSRGSGNHNSVYEFHSDSMYSAPRIYSDQFLSRGSSSGHFDHSDQTPNEVHPMPTCHQSRSSMTTFDLSSCLMEKNMPFCEFAPYRSLHSTLSVQDSHQSTIDKSDHSPGALRVFPGLAYSNYSGINPILASTYPTFPNHYIDYTYKPLPTLPMHFTHNSPTALSGKCLGHLSQPGDFGYT